MKYKTKDSMQVEGHLLEFSWYYNTKADWDVSTDIAAEVFKHFIKHDCRCS